MAAKRMMGIVVVILAMAQAASAQVGVTTWQVEGTQRQLADAAKTLDGATQAGGPTAAQNQQYQTEVHSQETTQDQLAQAAKQLDATTQAGGPTAAQNQSQALKSAAKQLDAASSSGGPTAALNQKIQE